MFDITSSKLLILAIVALIVVGPKDLPQLLRTVGKYLGAIRRQAAEFRAQLDDALRETELEQMKKDVEGLTNEMRSTLDEGARSIDSSMETARRDVDNAVKSITEEVAEAKLGGLERKKPAEIASEVATESAEEPRPDSSGEASAPPEKTGT
jgi:sec-independent protein translocase protein TatB